MRMYIRRPLECSNPDGHEFLPTEDEEAVLVSECVWCSCEIVEDAPVALDAS